jgi:hypothetical protein
MSHHFLAPIADELSNKVKHLYSALHQAQSIISKLEQENNHLQDVLMGLTSINKENSDNVYEAGDDSWCAV